MFVITEDSNIMLDTMRYLKHFWTSRRGHAQLSKQTERHVSALRCVNAILKYWKKNKKNV